MMEQHRFPRRSASHGTLRSSYSSHGGQGVGPPPYRPLHKPLRSVNENSVLLHSPGALESMLKTTTETGDIGIFTIKPVPPSPLTPRDSISEVGHPYPRLRRSVDNLYRQNLPVRPPSHRDTTSEAFSVYGSDSLKSGTSTLSPNSTEDPAQRSYSMTTCGSRHLSHHKSTNTLQSQASGSSNLQRPRSPFPYPTRLKRPGIRPASPAVTENGQIDYSRMRTVHGHFKHAYSPMSRRPYPLGLRSDVNRSTPSLAPPGPPPSYHGPPLPPSVRTYSPASMASWNLPFHEGLDGTSPRTSSLTSVTNMYRRMPPLLRTGQSFPAEPPRYYDYTEDFENKPPQLTPLVQAVTPLVPRTFRYPQPIMLRADGDHLAVGNLAAVFGEGDSAFYECESQVVDDHDTLPIASLAAVANPIQEHTEPSDRLTSRHHDESASSEGSTIELEASEMDSRNARSSDIDLLPSQIGRDSIDTFNPNLDIESRNIQSSYHYVTYHANTTPKTKTKSPERQVQVLGGRALTIRSEQGVILRDDTNYETTGRQSLESCHSHVVVEINESHSPAQPCEPNSNRDFASQKMHDNRGISMHNGPQPYALPIEGPIPQTASDSPRPKRRGSSSMAETVAKLDKGVEGEIGKQAANHEPEMSQNQQFRRHRRNHAVLRISTTTLPREDNEGHPHITPTCSTAPLVSPKPISPARQLKVKNSIPQLMKALPPLPGALGYDLPLAAADVPEEDEFAEILVPFSFHQPHEPSQPNQLQAVNLGPMIGSETAPNAQRDGPKFRLKIKTNGCSETSHADENLPQLERVSDTETSDELGEKNVRSRTQNKLKVRSPRRTRLSSSHYSTVRHNPGLETRRIVTDLVQQKPPDLFFVPPKSETALLRKRRKPLPQLVCSQASTITSLNSSGLVSSDERVNLADCRAPSNTMTNNDEESAFDNEARISSMPPHGLIKRLSNLRALLSSTNPSAPRIRVAGSLRIHKVTSGAFNNADFDIKNSLKTSGSSATEATQRRLGRRIRARLSKWVRGAKTAMRKCVKKKHSRHEQDEIENT
ncbi:hypothetical protein FHL15_006052 [Xylaria flabelliformis]|uniref:Uncharacterized protein n=1 Tax=Xylaria flabelliformis TaxID=2512241 RepID=A0A553HZ18_9PEZI|nr:hypothetical protein FHL15_006052 [Xylaria flabelliformis]